MKKSYNFTAIKLESILLKYIADCFNSKGFTRVITPHITKIIGSCEDVSTLLRVEYFGERASLSQTQQLFLELTIPELKKVWCYGPSFRAEPRADNRHLTEFTLVETEFKCKNLEELLHLIEELFTYTINKVLSDNTTAPLLPKERITQLTKFKIPLRKITYNEAKTILNEGGYTFNFGNSLKTRHEKFLIAYYREPFFITHFPKQIKFFNMQLNKEDERLVDSADLILPHGLETIGAAVRSIDYTEVLERLRNSSMLNSYEKIGGTIKDFNFYLDFLKGEEGIPHAGCGIGLNRFVQYLLGYDDIRKATGFPLNRELLR